MVMWVLSALSQRISYKSLLVLRLVPICLFKVYNVPQLYYSTY